MKIYASKTVRSIAVIATLIFSIQACAKDEQGQDAMSKEAVSKGAISKANNAKTKQSSMADNHDFTEEELALLRDDSNINIAFANKSLQVEFADSFDERALGLMHRKTLCEDCGMLFQFDSEMIASIWMKNTFVALDLAYITVDGKIVDIKPLEPHDLTSVRSSEPVLYALEMNQGWFAKNGIKVGDKVSIEGRVKQASFK